MRAPANTLPKFFPLSATSERTLTSRRRILVGRRGAESPLLTMATLIPDSLVVRTAFAGFLLDVAKRQQSPYFYVISGGDEDEPSSLCHVCGLSDEDFNGLLILLLALLLMIQQMTS